MACTGMGQLKLLWLFGVFMTSAVLGDAVNYAIGNKLGAWLGNTEHVSLVTLP
jgi:membrane protein DedA with SNARE-associated domain